MKYPLPNDLSKCALEIFDSQSKLSQELKGLAALLSRSGYSDIPFSKDDLHGIGALAESLSREANRITSLLDNLMLKVP